MLLKGSRAFYRGPKGIEKVTIAGVHHDAKLEPYYTVRFRDGKEKQTDGKCLTPIEEKKEGGEPPQRRGSYTTTATAGSKTYASGSEQPTDQCSSSSSEHDEEERFHKGQDAYYRSSSREGVTKVKIVERIGSNRYTVVLGDGSKRQVEGENLAGLIDLTSKELAGLMKEKNEKHSSTADLRSSVQSKESVTIDDPGYEPEAEPSSSENSYEDNIQNDSPSNNGTKILSLPCAVQMVEAKTEEGGTKLVPLYKAEMDVYYRGPQGVTTAHIVKTHLDDLLEPYYTIRLEDGREKQTDNAHISLEKPDEVGQEPEENGAFEETVDDDDWYQEWKENQLKQEQALRDEMKEFEDREQNNPGSVEASTEPRSSIASEDPVIVQEKQLECTKEERSEPDPSMTALVPKHYTERADPERTESRVETPQVKKQDPDDSQNALVQAPQFNVGDTVLYNSSKGDHMRASITKIRKDDKNRPYFVVKLSSGDEKKVYGHRLTPIRREERDQRDASRTRSRSRSVSRRDREKLASSRRSTSVDPRRLTRMNSVESTGSRDASVDRSRCSSTRRKANDRSRSMSRTPKENSKGSRAESRDPRGRSQASEGKESRSRSKSVRTPREPSSRDFSENRQRARSRSRAPDDLKRSGVSRKAPMVMGVSHRVQHIGDEEGSLARSKSSTSRFGKLKSSISSGISKAKQRSFDR